MSLSITLSNHEASETVKTLVKHYCYAGKQLIHLVTIIV